MVHFIPELKKKKKNLLIFYRKKMKEKKDLKGLEKSLKINQKKANWKID